MNGTTDAFSITMHGGVCTVVPNILHNCNCQSKRTFKPCYSLLVCIVSTQGRIFPFYNDNGSRVGLGFSTSTSTST